MKKILLSVTLVLLLSMSAFAKDITVNENVKLGGIIVSAPDFEMRYTGYDPDRLYFDVAEENTQYQIVVMHAMKTSMFSL